MEDFAPATPEQRALVMLMERLGALEDQVLASQRQIARLEARQAGSTAVCYSVGKRVLWNFTVATGHLPISCGVIALTDLGADLAERALARGSGPLFEHITSAQYDRSSSTEPFSSYLKAAPPLRTATQITFIDNIDAGLLVVHGIRGSVFDVMEELHGLLEEDDNEGKTLCTMHSLRINIPLEGARKCVEDFVAGVAPALPVVPGGMYAALDRYIAEHDITDAKQVMDIKAAFQRPYYAVNGGGSTRINRGF
jgi:hypothetical protein